MSELKVHASACNSERMVHDNQSIRAAFVARLKEAALEAGFQERGLGARLKEITGVSAKAAYKWLSEESMPERASMLRLADIFEVRAEWLEHGTPPKRHPWKNREGQEDGTANVHPVLQPNRQPQDYPLISWVAAGGWMESCDNFQPGDAEEWLPSEENAGQHGYWLEVKGKSMYDPSGQAPISFPPGYRILVRPEGFDVISGKFYIARVSTPGGTWETTFKQYIRDAGMEYLQPINPAFETIRIDSTVEIIGRVVDTRPPRSLL